MNLPNGREKPRRVKFFPGSRGSQSESHRDRRLQLPHYNGETSDAMTALGHDSSQVLADATKPAVIITVKDGKLKYMETISP